MTSVQTVKQHLDHRPFRPFRVKMSSGAAYEVHQREMAFLTKGELVVGLEPEDGVPTEFKICTLLHLTAIEPLEANATPSDSC